MPDQTRTGRQLPADVHPEVVALLTTRALPRNAMRNTIATAVPAIAGLILLTIIGWVLSREGISGGPAQKRIWLAVFSVLLAFAIVRLAPLRRFPLSVLLTTAGASAASSVWLTHSAHVLLASCFLAVSALALGLALAGSVDRLIWALPVTVVAAISDLTSSTWGPTGAWLQERRGELGAGTLAGHVPTQAEPWSIDYAVLLIPVPGGLWMVGAVDIMFAALLAGAGEAFALSRKVTAAALATACALSVVIPGGAPLLPLLAAAFLAGHLPRIAEVIRFEWHRWMARAPR